MIGISYKLSTQNYPGFNIHPIQMIFSYDSAGKSLYPVGE